MARRSSKPHQRIARLGRWWVRLCFRQGLSLKNEEFLTFEMPLLDLDMLFPG